MDTGILAEVPPEEWADIDEGVGSDASEGGDDLAAAAWAFAHPDGTED